MPSTAHMKEQNEVKMCTNNTDLNLCTVQCAAHVGCRNLHSVHSVQLNSV
jgi:hypothetical protein